MSMFWPGETRAAGVFDDAALLRAMTEVEIAWYRALHDVGLAPPISDEALRRLTSADDVAIICSRTTNARSRRRSARWLVWPISIDTPS
jgi:adenylosuccinate lyase